MAWRVGPKSVENRGERTLCVCCQSWRQKRAMLDFAKLKTRGEGDA